MNASNVSSRGLIVITHERADEPEQREQHPGDHLLEISSRTYSVICANRYEPVELLEAYVTDLEPPVRLQLTRHSQSSRFPAVVANGVEFEAASELLRALLAHGGPDMHYFMLPTQLWLALLDE